MDHGDLRDRRLSAPFWPEPVRILRVEPLGPAYEVLAEGLQSGRLHRSLLSQVQLETLLALLRQEEGPSQDPELFALGVEAWRIRLGYTFDPFFAVWASRVDPLPHQLEAVYGVLLKRPRVRFLLADDPGAGKTVMAGLFLKEMKYRGLVRRALVVTPANLVDQWRRELKEKFNESFVVVNRFADQALYGETPWERYDQAIVSMDFAKQDRYLEDLRRARWDLVIVDEAHKLSATRYGQEVKKSQRYRLGEVLSQTATHLLFLTATPHQGDEERFRLLLDLLEPGLFASAHLLREAAKQGENPILLRRLKEEMVDFAGKPLFPPRRVHTPTFRLSPSERGLYERVTAYVRKHFKRAWEERRRNVGLAMAVLQRRLASSTHAIARSLENRLRRLEALKEEALRLSGGEEALLEEDLEDLPEAERWRLEAEVSERLTLARNLPELEAEMEELKALAKEARTLARLEEDTKLKELLKVLSALGGEKLLVFTEHKDTLDFLVQALRKRGYRVTSIDGSMTLEERVERERVFRDEAQVLVATEAAGEGINLQFCAVMVNYDLPWNPSRLEQRMGRIHRYGQRYEVHIYNLVAQGTREGEVLRLLLEKLEAMRNELGSDRVYDVVGELLSGVSLEELILDHLTGRRTLEEIRALVESRLSPERVQYLREITLEALAKREVDLSRLQEALEESQARRLEPEYTERFFRRAMARLGGEVRRRGDGLFHVRVPYELRRERRLPPEYPRATFDPSPKGRAFLDAELLAPGHPLFDAVLEEILRLAEPHLRWGAVFHAPVEAPSCLGYLVVGVRNGLGQVVGRRLLALAEEGGRVRSLPPEVLVDALPASSQDFPCAKAGEALRRWAVAEVLPQYLEEVAEEALREAAIRLKYGLKSLEHLIGESAKRLAQLKLEALQGKDLRLAVQNEERRLEELKARRDDLERELAASEQIFPEGVELLALAHVLPWPSSGEPGEEDLEVRKRVEAVAMEVAMAYERSQGRDPVDVSRENLGYDLRSGDRFIEVKGRAGSGSVALTPNEWIAASRLGERYWLYIVTHALTAPRLYLLQNPAAKVRPGEEVGVVRYVVAEEAWRGVAEEASAPRDGP
jgi:superfamily II DNA or RNA helicase